MDLLQIHALATGGWLTLHGLGLLLSPWMTLTTILQETRDLSSLESYLARTLSIFCFSLALLEFALSGFFTSITANSSDSSAPSNSQNPAQTALVAVTTFFTAARSALFYTYAYDYTFNGNLLLLEVALSGGLTALGGLILLFGSGAGSNVKGRSHVLFDTPEHRAQVKERHKAKKGM